MINGEYENLWSVSAPIPSTVLVLIASLEIRLGDSMLKRGRGGIWPTHYVVGRIGSLDHWFSTGGVLGTTCFLVMKS